VDRQIAAYKSQPHGKRLLGGELQVFHCNFFNYWLQKTVLLVDGLGMEEVLVNAAASSAYAMLCGSARDLGVGSIAARRTLAEHTFGHLGFGLMDLSAVEEAGGTVRVPVSHYGQCLRDASGADFGSPQSFFDAGYAAGAAAFVFNRPAGTYDSKIHKCMALGADCGVIKLSARMEAPPIFPSAGAGAHWHGEPPRPNPDTRVDEGAVLAALDHLKLVGNEEGLIPRFGVMLTNHFAHFYNRLSFVFHRRMADTGMLEGAEELLVDAGYRCAFNTFGGIMRSAEWDAVVRPMLATKADWVHGMTAVVNYLGWGTWRVHELSGDRLVMRIYDDYESAGYVTMYGASSRPVSFLAAGGVGGLMNLVYLGNIADRPALDEAFYEKVFEATDRFRVRQVRSMAMGDAYTEIVAERLS
jgi:hypothetical protein